jgi:hypothetical protein
MGLFDGDFDGDLLGDFDGLFDGLLEGDLDGLFDGDLEGRSTQHQPTFHLHPAGKWRRTRVYKDTQLSRFGPGTTYSKS